MEKGIFSPRKIKITVAGVLLLAVFCTREHSPLKKGLLNLELGDYLRARACFESILDRQPASAPARVGLGKALLQQFAAHPGDTGLLDASLVQLEAARTLQPGREVESLLSIVRFKKASLDLSRGDTLIALQGLSRAISLDPKSIKAVNLAAILYFHQGAGDKALTLFRRVIEIDSSTVSGYFNMGMVYWTDSNFTAAYDAFFRAAQRSPDDREILQWAARAKERSAGATP